MNDKNDPISVAACHLIATVDTRHTEDSEPPANLGRFNRSGVILNPHYKDMGNLYGSEYWTNLLPKRAGEENVQKVTQARLPMGTAAAKRLGLVDRVLSRAPDDVEKEIRRLARELSASPHLSHWRRSLT